MSDPVPAPSRPKKNPLVRIVMVVAGIAAIATGIMQMKRGVQEMKMDPEVERLAKESDSGFAAANTDLAVAGPLVESAINAVDKDGLAVVRRDRKADIEKAIGLYGSASDHLRAAGQKADEAAAKKPGEKLEEFLKTKAAACRGFAAARDISREIARMLLDESIKTSGELGEKIAGAAQRSRKLEDEANEQMARADKLVTDTKK